MGRSIYWISVGAAFLTLTLHYFSPQNLQLIFPLAAISILTAGWRLSSDVKLLFLIPSLLFCLPVVFSIFFLVGWYPGSVALVAFLVALQSRLFFLESGRALSSRNSHFAEDLRACLPKKSILFIDIDIESESDSNSIEEGHLVRIRPGDRIPVDGQITFGSSFVDESPLTGEKDLKIKSMGSPVFAGTLNKNGSFIFKATSTISSSILARMAEQLEKGFAFSSLFSKKYLLLEGSCFLAALVYFLFHEYSFVVLNVFLVSSAAAFMAALRNRDLLFISQSSAQGYVWKNKEAVRTIAECETLVGESSGVFTEGRWKVSGILGNESISEDGALRLVAPLARRIENGPSFAILQEIQSRNIRLEMVNDFSHDVHGAKGEVDGEIIRWMDLETARLEKIPLFFFESFLQEKSLAGDSIQILLRAEKPCAAISFRDPVQSSTQAGLDGLKKIGVPFVLVSAESRLALQSIQKQFSLEHIHPETDRNSLSPLLERFHREGLRPLWIEQGKPKISHPGATVGTAARDGEALSLRLDLLSLARMLTLAKNYARSQQSFFLFAALPQLGLLLGAGFMHPLLAAFLAFLHGSFLVWGVSRGH